MVSARKNIYITLSEADAQLLKDLCRNECGVSGRKGLEQLVQTFIRSEKIQRMMKDRFQATRLKQIQKNGARQSRYA